jgi:thiol-disulfide isomerase/thioredoxin
MATASYVKIEKIDIRDTATVLWFHIDFKPGNWISIPKQTYIQPVGAKEKLFVVAAEGIPLNAKYTMPASGEVNFKLIFPKIDPSVTKIDYGEANDGATWFIYDIQLKPELFKSIIPEKIAGNWFSSSNAKWEISLLDSVAIYKSHVWKYVQYVEKQGIGQIKLKNGSKNLGLFIKPSDNGTCLIGETPSKLVNYTQTPDNSAIPADKETYKLPIFKSDTAIYCGYIKGFNPRFPQKTGMVYVNDVLSGEQNSILLTISDDGTFLAKIPHTNPQTVIVRLPFSNENLFIEPGKTTFHLIDNGSKSYQNLFMGDNGRINSDLQKLKNIISFDYNQMQGKVLDSSPEQYKNYIQDLQQKDLASVDAFSKVHTLSAKAIQIKKTELLYRYASYCFEYASNAESAYRKKNNIPQTQREIPFKPVKPDSSYYNFLTNDLVNNQLGVLVSDYYFFINRLMYLDILNSPTRTLSKSNTIPELVALKEKSGAKVTTEERDLARQLAEALTPEVKKIQDEYQDKYAIPSFEFHQKYAGKLQLLYKEKKGTKITPKMEEEYLLTQNIVFTDQEKAMLLAMKDYSENLLIKSYTSAIEKYGKQSQQFYTDHQEFIQGLYLDKKTTARNENFRKMLGIQPGFATDIMTSQDFCRPFSSEMTPVSDEKIRAFQQNISTPFIASYALIKNNETKAKIAANKNLKGSKANEVPKAAGDKIFDAIMEKYKGKVVYVDFWATWCAPCRSGIEQIKPLKDEMAGENVAFVYISGPSSPKATYDNMIPTIKGEHYRVSADEWNILCGMFKISGIPHYALVGKDGKVINPHLAHMENMQLKALLMKYIKE